MLLNVTSFPGSRGGPQLFLAFGLRKRIYSSLEQTRRVEAEAEDAVAGGR